MRKPSKNALVRASFDYGNLDRRTADTVRLATDRIRDKIKKTLTEIIGIGNAMLAVKEALPHGMFSDWLKAEIGYSERLAQNFMSVAQRFGTKSENVADLIQPAAAYLLSAPSVPDEARAKAIERAEAGERVNTVVAKEILAAVRKNVQVKRHKALNDDKLNDRLLVVLERFRDQWKPDELSTFAQRRREYADSL